MTRQLAERELRGEDSAQWLVALERESATSEKDEVELGLGLANDLYRFWIAHGRLAKAAGASASCSNERRRPIPWAQSSIQRVSRRDDAARRPCRGVHREGRAGMQVPAALS